VNIGIIGCGALGKAVAVTIAYKGHKVFAYDKNTTVMNHKTLSTLEAGPDGTGKLIDYLKNADIEFCSMERVLLNSDITFIAVQTPHEKLYSGEYIVPEDRKDFDYSHLISCMEEVNDCCRWIREDKVIAIISTVLPGTLNKHITPFLLDNIKLCYNPFFPAQLTFARDFLNPEFVLLGTRDKEATDKLKEFYSTIHNAPVMEMSIESAEITKVLYNLFISMKITYANVIMDLCHKIDGANIEDVMNTIKISKKRLISPMYLNGGLPDSGPCFPPGQIVITYSGPKPIETIAPGDLVLSGDGEFHRVLKLWENEYSGYLVEVKCHRTPKSLATLNHKFHVAQDIRKKYITWMRGVLKERRNSTPVVDALSEIKETPAGELRTGHHWTCFPIVKTEVVRPTHATDEYCKLMGWYLAEGSLYNQIGASGKMQSSRIRFDLHRKEIDVAEELSCLLTKISPPKTSGRGVGSKITVKFNGENGLYVRYGSSKLGKLLLDDCGKGAANKVLPPWALWSNKRTAALILNGMFRGDGMVKTKRTTYSTISCNLAYGVQMILDRFGICSSLRCIEPRVSKKGQKHQRSYEVRISNLVDLRLLWDFLSLGKVDREQPKLYTRFPVIDGKRFCPIVGTKLTEYTGKVYNLEVEETHNYVTSAGLVSNCHARDVIAMSYLARLCGVHANLFDNIIEAREEQIKWFISLIKENKEDLPIILLGKAFKPESNMTVGSAALLMSNIMKARMIDFKHIDPLVDERDYKPTDKALYFIATKHGVFKNYSFPEGSIVIDPFRYIDNQKNVKVIRIGE
jgi:UDP-glucose 6-dehydrogenase